MDWNELDSELPFDQDEFFCGETREEPEETGEAMCFGPVLVLAPDEFDSFYRQYKAMLNLHSDTGKRRIGIPEYKLDIWALDAGVIDPSECNFLGCDLDLRHPFRIEHFTADPCEQTAMLTLGRSHFYIYFESGCYVVFLGDRPLFQENHRFPPPRLKDIYRLYAGKIGGYLPRDFDWLEHIGIFYYCE